MTPQLSRRTIVAIYVIGVVVLALLGAAVGASATAGPWCANCHSKGEFGKATSAAPHSAVACIDCHGGTTVDSRIGLGVSEVFSMRLRIGGVDSSVAHVPDAKCLKCHDRIDEGISESAGLRIAHATCAKSRQCTDCHSTTAHGTAQSWPKSATMEMCFDCHGDKAPDDCNTCHESRLPADRIQTGTWSVTHGPNYKKTHGLGEMRTCTPCHDSSKCGKCHGPGLPHGNDFIRKHGTAATSAGAKCTSCHLKKFCSDCHSYSMPHSLQFKKTHAKVVERDGEKKCLRCHEKNDCTKCHTDHVHPVTLEQLEQMGGSGGGDGQ